MDYRELNSMIGRLHGLVDKSDPKKGHWKDVWGLVRDVGAGFKHSSYPSSDEHNAAWDSFQRAVSRAKKSSNEAKREFERRQEEWERRQQRSQQATANVRKAADRAKPGDLGKGVIDIALDIMYICRIFITAEVFYTELDMGNAKTELARSKNKLLKCSAALKDAWNKFTNLKKDMLPSDKHMTYEKLTEAGDALDKAWDRWKASSKKLHESHQARFEKGQKERREKREKFVKRVSANITKLRGKLSNAENALARAEANLRKIKGQRAEAWSDSFRSKCDGWIFEETDRTRNIREHIDRIKGWIRDEEDKIG